MRSDRCRPVSEAIGAELSAELSAPSYRLSRLGERVRARRAHERRAPVRASAASRAMARVSDPRFAKLHTDPRFQRQPKKDQKVAVDKRFAAMFHDDDFADSAGVDKYGRKVKKEHKTKKADSELSRLYALDAEEEETAPRKKEAKKGKKAAEPAAAKPAAAKAKAKAKPAAAKPAAKAKAKAKPAPRRAVDPRFQLAEADEDSEEEADEDGDEDEDGAYRLEEDEPGSDEEDDESMTESASSSDEEGEAAPAEGSGADADADSALVSWLQSNSDVKRTDESTSRLAVVNCDWDKARAAGPRSPTFAFVPDLSPNPHPGRAGACGRPARGAAVVLATGRPDPRDLSVPLRLWGGADAAGGDGRADGDLGARGAAAAAGGGGGGSGGGGSGGGGG